MLGVIGAGGYVPAMLLPHFKTEGVEFRSIATASGISAHDVGKRFGFAYAVSSADEVLDDASVNLVVIGTQTRLCMPNSHARRSNETSTSLSRSRWRSTMNSWNQFWKPPEVQTEN